MVTNYIWKDTAYVTSAETLDWTLVQDGTTVASGVSHLRPGEEWLKVYVNRLAEDWLESTYPSATGLTTDDGACMDFTLQDSSGNTLGTYRFILGSVGEVREGISSDPVNGHADCRQRIFAGGYFASATNVTIQGI